MNVGSLDPSKLWRYQPKRVSGCKFPGCCVRSRHGNFSDGQLRFLCLSAALLSPRPPSLLARNEPETSLHPDLINSLARLMVRASKHTHLWITTHSRRLAENIEQHSGLPRVRLCMVDGETKLDSSTGPDSCCNQASALGTGR